MGSSGINRSLSIPHHSPNSIFKACFHTAPLLPDTSSSSPPPQGGHHPAQLPLERRDVGHKWGERLLDGQQRQGVAQVPRLWPRLHPLPPCTTSPSPQAKTKTESPIRLVRPAHSGVEGPRPEGDSLHNLLSVARGPVHGGRDLPLPHCLAQAGPRGCRVVGARRSRGEHVRPPRMVSPPLRRLPCPPRHDQAAADERGGGAGEDAHKRPHSFPAAATYKACRADELTISKGDRLFVIRRGDFAENGGGQRMWWWVRNSQGTEGYVLRDLLALNSRHS